MADAKQVTACVLIIGNEILSGRTKDANLPWLALRLNDLGVRLREARIIPDVEAVIVRTINEIRGQFDYVFTTGGIGPTHDDITAECVAKAFGVRLLQNPEAVARLRTNYARPEDLNAARLRMANIPEGARLIDNPVSKAPGFQIGNVYVMAGVPAIMQAMFDGFKHELVGGAKVLSRTVTAELAEGKIAEGLTALQGRYADVEIGSYPSYRLGRFALAIVMRGTAADRLTAAVAELKALMRSLGAEPTEEAA
ncbi:MAG: competence/damage-inducible protein A [Proteobacteria bacterium]|nr:competence/damage-inducible protein A [Pseudomonadota bacterium]